MKIKELIEQLETLDQELDVFFADYEYGPRLLTKVDIEKDGSEDDNCILGGEYL